MHSFVFVVVVVVVVVELYTYPSVLVTALSCI